MRSVIIVSIFKPPESQSAHEMAYRDPWIPTVYPGTLKLKPLFIQVRASEVALPASWIGRYQLSPSNPKTGTTSLRVDKYLEERSSSRRETGWQEGRVIGLGYGTA
jgi:hypothetical protein